MMHIHIRTFVAHTFIDGLFIHLEIYCVIILYVRVSTEI